ncbi:conserved hypothetical protein [Catenulispora acidiphila DSM 44928]|uniref:DUF4097 domain-containing protein n=1 Tax=Catenulispora acidiphila (strain DSM 44928 / JCM 14897 / NBRC 102108 / NRRL B-24433 / ID139908) TaxID=479433 RepID=C7PVJ1_CATAD|nr:DUF4097 family beta strand repeat-containing protein [Catenulispora acidiphila]ACU69347.1 conserved hypothetical protein [Catenulispora acidiphila DSM 44928]
MQKFETPSPVTVVLDIPAGQIRLVAGERADTVVEVLPSEASKRRDAKAAAQTTVEFSGGVLRIATADPHKILGSSGSLDVTIALPAGSRIEGKAGAAELHSTGRLGEVAFDGGYRSVELDEVAGARIKMHMGDVSIAKLTGPAQLRNGKGDITVAEAAGGAVDLRTDMGDLKIAAAPGVSGTLDASSASGRITNALKNSEGAGAGLNIKATTSHGDIIATSL